MLLCFYFKDDSDNTLVDNVDSFSFTPGYKLIVQHTDGMEEVYENVDYISNCYDSKHLEYIRQQEDKHEG